MEAVTKERMRELDRVKQRLQLGGGGDRLEKQHTSGKLSARERLALLLDRKSFREAGLFAKHNGRLFGMDGKELPADGVVTGAAESTGGWCTWPARISPWRAARRAKCTATRSPTP